MVLVVDTHVTFADCDTKLSSLFLAIIFASFLNIHRLNSKKQRGNPQKQWVKYKSLRWTPYACRTRYRSNMAHVRHHLTWR